MYFNYTDTFFVHENEFEEMVRLYAEEGYSPTKAIEEVSSGWDDCDFYMVGKIEDQLVEKIKEELKK